MKKYHLTLILFLLSFTIAFCQSNYEGESFCDLLKEMNQRDQEQRKVLSNTKNNFFKILEDLWTKDGLTLETYGKLPKEKQLEYGRKARAIVNKIPSKFTDKQVDSIMVIQTKLDNINTELLIDIIEKRGYPNEKNTKCKEFPGFIFSHAQKQYWGKIRELIEIEYKAGRLEDGTYKHNLWHINGRVGKPF